MQGKINIQIENAFHPCNREKREQGESHPHPHPHSHTKNLSQQSTHTQNKMGSYKNQPNNRASYYYNLDTEFIIKLLFSVNCAFLHR